MRIIGKQSVCTINAISTVRIQSNIIDSTNAIWRWDFIEERRDIWREHEKAPEGRYRVSNRMWKETKRLLIHRWIDSNHSAKKHYAKVGFIRALGVWKYGIVPDGAKRSNGNWAIGSNVAGDLLDSKENWNSRNSLHCAVILQCSLLIGRNRIIWILICSLVSLPFSLCHNSDSLIDRSCFNEARLMQSGFIEYTNVI